MARFIVGHRWRNAIDRAPWLERILYRLDHAFFSSLLWLIRQLPVERASRLGAAMGALLGPRFRKNRSLLENFAIAFPDATREELQTYAREAWANAGAVFAEYVHLQEIRDGHSPRRLVVVDLLGIGALVSSGKPAVFVAAHQANWELTAAAVTLSGLPLTVVYSPPTNPLLDRLMQRWRQHIGCGLIPREESMRPLMKALSSGTSVGMVMDRRVDSGHPVALFGHDKPTSLIAARLAIRYRIPLIPVRVERTGTAGFRVTLCAPIDVPEAGDELGQAAVMTADVHRLFESWIRERPGQWFPSKRLWPKAMYPRKHSAPPIESEPA